jgi:Uma2 family endonuclease
VAYPKNPHLLAQQTLRDLLDAAASGTGRAYTEAGFRPLREHEGWVADVVYLSPAQLSRFKTEEYFHGAPELVIEVLSPSNTVAEIL